ncbi:MAG: glycosyltransferase family 39 protein [Chloroflexaceae bacterium]|nr:glycosyltransferase family 39 protein [Chloroflexaceae bacterium]
MEIIIAGFAGQIIGLPVATASRAERGTLATMHAEQPHQPIAADAATLPQPRTQWLALPAWVLAVLVTGIAFAFRSVSLADFFTTDESFHWIWRVQHFAGAVRQADWAGTNLTGHPGVTTLWLGTLGRLLALQQGIPTAGLADGSSHIAYLAALRLPIVVVNSLSVGIGYLLLRQWLSAPVALLAALLWAGEPFLIAHSRLLHLDGLLTSMMTLTILTLLVALDAPRRQTWVWLTLAGIWAGFALLTKGPALLLLPTVGLLLVLFGQPPRLQRGPSQWWQIGWQRIMGSIPPYVLWLGGAVLVFTSLWPVMWVDPQTGVARVWAEITGNGGIPHENGNYSGGSRWPIRGACSIRWSSSGGAVPRCCSVCCLCRSRCATALEPPAAICWPCCCMSASSRWR